MPPPLIADGFFYNFTHGRIENFGEQKWEMKNQ